MSRSSGFRLFGSKWVSLLTTGDEAVKESCRSPGALERQLSSIGPAVASTKLLNSCFDGRRQVRHRLNLTAVIREAG